MQYINEAYRNELGLPFRGKSHVKAYIGLVNSEAQQNATITSNYSGSETHLYDGSELANVSSTERNGSMTFTFGNYYQLNIAGITLKLRGELPDYLVITNGSTEATIAVEGEEVLLDEGFMECHTMTITPNVGKLSLKSILFGVGLQFTDKQIINTYRENIVSHIANELPIKIFTLTVDNRNHLFNKDNPYGYANYIEEKQEIRYEYSRELEGGGEYKIKGGKVLIQKWSSDDYQAKFTCAGYLDFLEGKFYKGQFYENGISAFDLAKIVFADAGITNYKLDSSMKSVMIYNPIPVIEYRDALKMIANASRCTLYEDRDGDICIKNSNEPSFIGQVEFFGGTRYSIPSSILEDNSDNYADAEYEYAKADGSLIFLPEVDSFRNVGFVSSELADENGHFSNDPHIDITFVSEYTMKRAFLFFSLLLPTSITITCKLAGEVVDTQTITNIDMTTIYSYEGNIDFMRIEFNSAYTNQRIHLNYIDIDGQIDYLLTYHELKYTPIANSLERVKNLRVHYYTYNKEVTEGEVTSVSAVSTIKAVKGNNTVILNEPYYDYRVSAGEIVEQGAYYLVVYSQIGRTIDIYATPYNITENIHEIGIHEKGVEKNSENPLVSTLSMAKQQGRWLEDYFDDDIDYDLTYRGDPILDADDLIYLENHFVLENQIRIERETISTSMGMDFSCQLQARRTFYMTDARADYAVVGRFRVGEVLGGGTTS